MADFKDAQISSCGSYRFTLERRWGNADENSPYVNWIMLNPSVADHERDDPTIRRCRRFTSEWGYSRLVVTNLYPLITPYPPECRAFAEWRHRQDWHSRDVIHHQNLPIVEQVATDADCIIVAWGNAAWEWDDTYPGHVLEEIACHTDVTPLCLGVNDSGAPRHPSARGRSFVPYDFVPIEWPVRE